jgi:Bacterial Ig-like domain (group 2)/Divergent InlB B-repeat domain
MKKLTKAFFLVVALVLMAGLCLVAAGPAVAIDDCLGPVPLTYIDNPVDHGSLSGDLLQWVECGGDGTAVEAVPDDCYHFVKWSDESTDNPRTDTNVTENITVEASFEINTYTLTYYTDENGMILGNTSQTVNCGGNGTPVLAVPLNPLAYHFEKWSDDSTDNPRMDGNVTKDITVQALFAPCIDIAVTMDGNTVVASLDGVQMILPCPTTELPVGEPVVLPVGEPHGGCGNITVIMDPNTITGLLNGEPIISLPNPMTGLPSDEPTSLPITDLDSLCGNFQVVIGNKTITASIGNGAYGVSITDGCSSITLSGVPINPDCVPINPPADGSPGFCANIAAKIDGNTITASLNGEPIVVPFFDSSGNCNDIIVTVNEDRTIAVIVDGEPIVLPIDAIYYLCASITVDLGGDKTMTANYANGSFGLSVIDGCRSVNFYGFFPPPPPCVAAVEVQPGDAPIMIGGMQQFSAWAYFYDGSSEDVTSLASWNSSNGDVAGIDNVGLANGVGVGTSDVQATYDGVTSDPVTVTVNAYVPNTLVSLEVRPDNATIQAGDSQQLTAWAEYNDGTEVDVTDQVSWDSSNEDVAGIDNTGLANGVGVGTVDITATLLGESGDAVLSVTAPAPIVEVPPANATVVPVAAAEPTVLEVVVEPDSASVVAGGTKQLKATANYSDGTTADVTSTASWDSSKAGVCTVASGVATGVAPGACAITATYGDETGTAVLTVTTAKLISDKDVGDSEITADQAPVSDVPVSVPWSMIGGIIGAVLVLGLLFMALMRRRTKGAGT